MPVYQAEGYLQAAIASCQAQSYPHWELCIVDDGSEDDSHAIAYALAEQDARIQLVKQRHQGCPATRNHCLNLARGQLVARQDADDLQHPQRLEKQLNYLRRNAQVDIVTCGMRYFSEDKPEVQPVGSICMDDFKQGMQVGKYMHNQGGRPVCASIMAWRDVYDRVGEFNPFLTAGSDGEWNFRAISKQMRWGFVDEPLYYYRYHGQQISGRLAAQQNQNHEAARLRYYEVWCKS